MDSLWENKYQELVKYKASHSGEAPSGPCSLVDWCYNQQKLYNDGKMKEERVRRLREAGLLRSWDERYRELLLFRASHRGEDPDGSVPQLQSWCATQRKAYRKGSLAEDRRAQLEEAGFDLTVSPAREPTVWQRSMEKKWNTQYQHLKKFYLEHKHCHVTCKQVHPSLLRWIKRQQESYCASKLSDERLQLLKEIEFPFDSSQRRRMDLVASDPKPSNGTIIDSAKAKRQVDQPKAAPEVDFDMRNPPEPSKKVIIEPNAPLTENNVIFNREVEEKYACKENAHNGTIIDSAKTKRRVEQPKAAPEVDFDMRNPPEPSKKMILEPNTPLTEHDVIFIREGEEKYSCKGNAHFDELLSNFLSDFQSVYVAASRSKKRASRSKKRPIAKSLVTIVKNRLGRFFRQDLDGRFHELTDEGALEKVIDALDMKNTKEGLTSCSAPLEPCAEKITQKSSKLPLKQPTRDTEKMKKFDTGRQSSTTEASLAVHDVGSDAWERRFSDLNSYIRQHGRPPQTRDESPSLYDWLQVQKARQSKIDHLTTL